MACRSASDRLRPMVRRAWTSRAVQLLTCARLEHLRTLTSIPAQRNIDSVAVLAELQGPKIRSLDAGSICDRALERVPVGGGF